METVTGNSQPSRVVDPARFEIGPSSNINNVY